MTPVTPELLRRHGLPGHVEGDKDKRGRVLIVGGSVEVPGGLLLAGIAALRVGAGKLQLATCRSVAVPMGLAVPEALVYGLQENDAGGIAEANADRLAEAAKRTDAVLIGPGTMPDAGALTAALLPRLEVPIVLDAGALAGLPGGRLAGRGVITPHCGEMAHLLEQSRGEVEQDPLAAGRLAASRHQCVVVVKGARSFIVSPDGSAWSFAGGTIGLATSGSGDALAGLIAGLLARGAEPVWAAIWGVYLHGEAGTRLFRRYGGIGMLAREIADEVPGIMGEFT